MSGRFLKLRFGLAEHLRNGKLTMTEHSAYVQMLLYADFATGIWQEGGAKALAGICGNQLDERAAQRLLASLESKNYISRDRQNGQRGNYPIQLYRYMCPGDGTSRGTSFAAVNSTDATGYEETGEDRGTSRGTTSWGRGTSRGSSDSTSRGTSLEDVSGSSPITSSADPESRGTSSGTSGGTSRGTYSRTSLEVTRSDSATVTSQPATQDEAQRARAEGHTEEKLTAVDSLITGIYKLAKRAPVLNEKNRELATELLRSNKPADLMAAIRYCSKEPFWLKVFQDPKLAHPVSMFSKKLHELQKQLSRSAKPKKSSPVQPQRAQHAPTPVPATPPVCGVCGGTGLIHSKRTPGKVLPCFCKPR